MRSKRSALRNIISPDNLANNEFAAQWNGRPFFLLFLDLLIKILKEIRKTSRGKKERTKNKASIILLGPPSSGLKKKTKFFFLCRPLTARHVLNGASFFSLLFCLSVARDVTHVCVELCYCCSRQVEPTRGDPIQLPYGFAELFVALPRNPALNWFAEKEEAFLHLQCSFLFCSESVYSAVLNANKLQSSSGSSAASSAKLLRLDFFQFFQTFYLEKIFVLANGFLFSSPNGVGFTYCWCPFSPLSSLSLLVVCFFCYKHTHTHLPTHNIIGFIVDRWMWQQ